MRHIKKYSEATKELQKVINDAKEKLLQEILNDTELSKVDKLGLISDNHLFKTDPYICDVFGEYYDEYFKKLNVRHPIIDDYFHTGEYDRHQTVNLADLVESIDEGYEGDELIVIMTNRNTTDVMKISKYEFIDTVYDWCVKNKTIAFELDW